MEPTVNQILQQAIASHKEGKIEEAEKSYKKAIELKPDFPEAHNNLGNTLNYKGDLVESIDSYKQALNIQPDYAEAWLNVLFPLQAIKLQTSSVEDHIPLLDEQVSCKYAQVAKSILSYRLNLGNPSTDSSLNKALNILSSADNIFIKNPHSMSINYPYHQTYSKTSFQFHPISEIP